MVSVLFLVQATVGAAVEHYRVELEGFFGFDLAQIFPFNLARTWHVQLSLLWTAAVPKPARLSRKSLEGLAR